MGYSYPSINGVIVNDAPYTAWDLNAEIPGAYQWQFENNATKKNPAHYLFGCTGTPAVTYDANGKVVATVHTGVDFTGIESTDGDTYKAAFNKWFDKENFSLNTVSPAKGLSIKVKDLVSSIKVFLPQFSNGFETVTEVTRLDAAAMSAWARDNNIDVTKIFFWWIMDKSGNVVVYIEGWQKVAPVAPVVTRGDIATGYVEVQGTQSVKNPAVRDEALIAATVSGILEPAVLKDGKITGGNTIEAISFEWTGIATEENHKAIDLDDFHFGRTDDCDKINWNAVVKYTVPTDAQRVYDIQNDCIVTGLYDNHSHNADEPEVCDLIKKVTFPIDATKIAMPTWEDIKIPTGLEEAEFVLKCHDSTVTGTGLPCGCTYNVNGTIMSFNFALTDWEKQLIIDAANAYYAYHPTVTYIEVEFWDSNTTKYQFQVEVYAYARVTAVTNQYGHTSFVLAGVEYAADVVGAFIQSAYTGAGFDLTGADRPIDAPYMDTEVNVIANAANPEFGVIWTAKDIMKDANGNLVYLPWDATLGYKVTGTQKNIPAGSKVSNYFGGLYDPMGGTIAAPGTLASAVTYDAIWFDLVPSAVIGVNWHAVFPATPAPVPVTIYALAPVNDVTFLKYYFLNSRP
jgi:hypothetical protein